jgi:regulator of sigma E protease
MPDLTSLAQTLLDLLLVVIGFGLIIFIHELGHFLAARWAGIRVLAFAIGFGPAIVSYRKGLGWRRGSSEEEYHRVLDTEARGATLAEDRVGSKAISPTEYRINVLPLGGYVRMLGQEDLNPAAVSGASDSYQNVSIPKRMVVISAGVVMNLISAAVLFVVVFLGGLKTEPPLVGTVRLDGPAATAVAVNAEAAGVTDAGLKPGDEVLLIDGKRPRTFADVALEVATASPGRVLPIVVEREGTSEPLRFEIMPEPGAVDGLLQLGFGSARSLEVFDSERAGEREQLARILASEGLDGVEPGMRLVSADGRTDLTNAGELDSVFRASGGAAVELVFEDEGGATVEVAVRPRPEAQTHRVPLGPDSSTPVEHILGLMPVLTVAEGTDPAQGLAAGDVFLRIGSVEYPSMADGIAEIRAHRGQPIVLEVLREGAGGVSVVTIEAKVNGKGQVGFAPADTYSTSNLLALPPTRITAMRADAKPTQPAAASVIDRPGTRLLAVNGVEVATLAEAGVALREAVADGATTAELTLALPYGRDEADEPAIETVSWTIPADDAEALRSLSWKSPFSYAVFEPEQFLLKADGPVEAIGLGIHETHRVMISTYVTFARLFQGTVKIEHLKGPVGIAHLGTLVAGRGMIWLLFFLAMISVNLAVINFLPLPIVDGGQFLMLAYEGVRGRPLPIPVQNAVTMAGLVLIASMFLIVTFNDLRNLLGL